MTTSHPLKGSLMFIELLVSCCMKYAYVTFCSSFTQVFISSHKLQATDIKVVQHALWYQIGHRRGGTRDVEPYFDGQPLPELGFSMEEAVGCLVYLPKILANGD